jgi:hypothetical protein
MRTGLRLTHGPLVALWRLGATSLGLLLAVVASDRLLGSLIEHDARWRSSQDPRERILWDSDFDGSPVVLIGDSEFSSAYVDSPQETLWARLSALSGEQVFPAALNGANWIDLLMMAKRVAALWPPGTTAFIGIVPARIFVPHVSSPPRSYYFAELGLLVDYHYANESWLQRVEGRLIFELARRSFLIRNRQWILRYLQSCLTGRPFNAEHRSRTWNAEGVFALNTFRALEDSLAARWSHLIVPASWAQSLEQVLSERGIRPVFVLLPLNVALIRQYSDGKLPIEQMLTASHDYLVRELLASGFSFVDLFRGLDSSSFADLAHTNSRGDDAIAVALSDWLRAHRLAYKLGRQDLGAPTSHQDY